MEQWRTYLAKVCTPSAADAHYEEFRDSLSAGNAAAFSRATEMALDASLAKVQDRQSVLSLRDWVCARVSESRRRQPLHPADIRKLMETLRNAPGEHRAREALEYVQRECRSLPATEAGAVAALLPAWSAQPAPRTSACLAAALDAALPRLPLDSPAVLELSSSLECSALEFLRMLHDAEARSLALPSRWVGASLVAAPATAADLFAETSESTLPPLEDMYVILRDGRLVGTQKTFPSPRVCAQLGEVVAAASVPLSSFIVAIVRASCQTRAHLVLWSAQDLNSYAILNEHDAACPDVVDAQLTREGDVFVRTGQRQPDGTCADVLSYCVRMTGTDVSTLRHVDVEDDMEALLAERTAQGRINHMDHGNVMAVERAFDASGFHTRARYGALSARLPVDVSPLAVFGNPQHMYVWHPSGSVFAGQCRDGQWAFQECGRLSGQGVESTRGALHLCETA